MEYSREFIEILEENLSFSLPGEKAQFLMEPITRKIEYKRQIHKSNPRESSILILLYPINKTLFTVMIKRPEYDGVHSGQIAFPGGKKEQQDQNLIDTALRESYEEVGIISDQVKLLGTLSELYIPPSNFNVLPVVGYSSARPDFIIDSKEVDKLLEIELGIFLDKNIVMEKEILSRRGM